MLYVMFICGPWQCFVGSYKDVNEYDKYRLSYHRLAKDWARSVSGQTHGKVRIVLLNGDMLSPDEELDAILTAKGMPWELTNQELQEAIPTLDPRGWYCQALRCEAIRRHIPC